MRIRILLFLQLILITFLYSCRASRNISTAYIPVSDNAYIEAYKDIAVNEMKRTGIPASITLAQGMIESDNGRSTLAREANNHFGIKCHNDWSGPKVYHDDDRRNECFRKYGKPEDSYHDHSEFLKSASRYSFLFNLSSTDYKGWAYGLKKAGYATNPQYPDMLIRKIEANNLHYYDINYKSGNSALNNQTPAKETLAVRDTVKNRFITTPVNENNPIVARVSRVAENNNLRYIIVKDGDTRGNIENEFQLLGLELARYNDLKNDFTISPGQILYLQPKKDKAEKGKDFYTSIEGDTMYLIAQRFGIKLRSLYKMNRMEEGSEIVPGTIIWLRNIKPVN